MSGVSPWLLAAVFAATTIASVLTGGEYRWLNVAVSAGIVSAVITAALMTRDGRQKLWMLAGVLSLTGSLTMAAVYYWQQSACTATNASGERVVIGTELTEQGRKYLLANPGDDNNVILESLGGSRPELAWTEASIWRCRLILASTGALWIPLFGVAAIAAVAVVVAGARPARRKGPRRVFLSYNHEDAAAAAELKRFLAGRGIEVTIDTERMAAGQRIEDFIDQSICDSDVVVSLVSNRSLLSAWVAMETIQGLSRSRWVEGKLFIACYLNDNFFRPEYRLECTRKIDERLKEIEELIRNTGIKRLTPSI